MSTVLTGLAFLASLLCEQGSAALAHPGTLDAYGGHFSPKLDEYHYHRPSGRMSQDKKKFLNWEEYQRTGELRGKIVKIDRPDAFWLQVAHRPAYQDLSKLLSRANRNNEQRWVRVWFAHVSPEASANQGKAYNQWFHKKVMYELGKKLVGREAVLRFRVVERGERIYAMVLLGKESINLWLVLNGWSYYLLTQGENPYAKEFIQAEALARKHKAGLWRNAR